MKIDAQRKIAELESRIVALEKACRIHAGVTRQFSMPYEPAWRRHWDMMWKEFDLMMRKAFGHDA